MPHLFFADRVTDTERVAEETGTTDHVEIEHPDPKKQAAKKGRRKHFPEHFPRIESVFEIPKKKRRCPSCDDELRAVGCKETKQLKRIELVIVHKTKRTK